MNRIRCCVPYCRRTTGKPVGEWICGNHWPLIPKDRRRAWGRLKRLWRRLPQNVVLSSRLDVVWENLKRTAIDRAAGIG